MVELLKGKPVADALLANAKVRAEALGGCGIVPTLALVRVGEDPSDLAYERAIFKCADAAGVEVRVRALPLTASQRQLGAAIAEINSDGSIHGCLMFRPLPEGFDEMAACELIAPSKDVDGVTRASLTGILVGAGDGFAPSTAEACVRLLDFYRIPLEGAHVTVVGRSLVVGKPLALMLTARDATVTLCHSHTRDLDVVCRGAEIVVCAAGRARAFGRDCFREGQVVVDVGINFDENGAICGDVDALDLEGRDVSLTPVPGGIGSITAAVTLDHVVSAAEAEAHGA